ncbi:FUSC family protein [Vibrio amylolyticus]|uniref:FUSC family protein n=1 Tax=Vibrio amylolyticus TaxID=2847292 RepID=UPI003551949D
MLNHSTKEAIKAALAIVSALCLAIWFEWDKPYWAGITTAVLALNETFAHSLQKGKNRVLGALMGAGYALFLISSFSQDHFLFVVFYTLLLAASLFMASDEKRGYIFVQGYTVCTIICCMGGFDSLNTFDYIILRLLETLLGIGVFTFVYRLIWPVSTESVFSHRYWQLHAELQQAFNYYHHSRLNSETMERIQCSASQLHHLLELPNHGSYDLQYYQHQWLERVREIDVIVHILESLSHKPSDLANYLADIERNLESTWKMPPTEPLLPPDLFEMAQRYSNHKPSLRQRSLKQHIGDDWKKVVQGTSTFLACILAWVYLPVPGGFVFPMIAGIFATNLPPLPTSAIRDAFFGAVGLGGFYLLQYSLIMPSFTELWQLLAFYFINIVAIWKVFDNVRLGIFRVLGVNLLLVLSSSALNLTPYYNIEMPLMMLVYVLIILAIAKLVSDLLTPCETKVAFDK